MPDGVGDINLLPLELAKLGVHLSAPEQPSCSDESKAHIQTPEEAADFCFIFFEHQRGKSEKDIRNMRVRYFFL